MGSVLGNPSPASCWLASFFGPARARALPGHSDEILADTCDSELPLHSFGGNELVRGLLQLSPLPPDNDHFQSVVVVQMNVHRGDDFLQVVMLMPSEHLLDVGPVSGSNAFRPFFERCERDPAVRLVGPRLKQSMAHSHS